MNEIYLDHNATTFMCLEAMGAMRNCAHLGNASSKHHKGVEADRKLVAETKIIRDILNIPNDARILFTSGATEANNLAMLGFGGWNDRDSYPGAVMTSGIEHPSILAPVDEMGDAGWETFVAGTEKGGSVDLDSIERILRDEATGNQVSVMALIRANHETGTIQPTRAASMICKEYDCRLHVDATQAVGKMSVDFMHLGATSMSFSAHKFGGPVGIGCLVVKEPDIGWIKPLLFGGHQQRGFRPGTLPVALVAGMAAALKHRDDYAGSLRSQAAKHVTLLEELLTGAGIVAAIHGGPPHTRVGNTTNISLKGIRATNFVSALNDRKVYCSTGAACSGEDEPSPTLRAMSVGKDLERSAIRFSVGISNTEGDIREAARRIIELYQENHDVRG